MSDILRFFTNIPPISRYYGAAVILTTMACVGGLTRPYELYFEDTLVFQQRQWWRLFTSFFFFSPTFNTNLLFQLFYLVHYFSQLESGPLFHDKPGSFAYMLLLGALALLMMAPLVGLYFLGPSLSFMCVYVWGRTAPLYMRINLFGMMAVSPPYLPWALLIISVFMGNDIKADLAGIAVGHVYFFLEKVLPQMVGYQPLRTPKPFAGIYYTYCRVRRVILRPLISGPLFHVAQAHSSEFVK